MLKRATYLEWFGVVTAVVYSLLIASNTGFEFAGFVLLFISAAALGAWSYFGKHRGVLVLQFFYASVAVVGMVRWF